MNYFRTISKNIANRRVFEFQVSRLFGRQCVTAKYNFEKTRIHREMQFNKRGKQREQLAKHNNDDNRDENDDANNNDGEAVAMIASG